MTLSLDALNKLSKKDLINIIIQLQNIELKDEKYKDVKLKFKRLFQNYNIHADGKRLYGFTVNIKNSVLYCCWRKYVPSGFGDNGIGGSFNIKLTENNLIEINNNGFTHEIILPIIEKKVFEKTGAPDNSCGALIAD